MTTTPSITSTTAASAAATAIKSLGSGSGIDIKSLASSLVEAESGPRKAVIDGRITKSQATISGYAALSYVLSQLQKAFADLKDKSDFAASAVTNSQPSAISVSAGASALAGNHSVTVTSLAMAQRNISAVGYASSSTSLNTDPITLISSPITLTLGGAAFPAIPPPTISVTIDTPAGVVAAINAAGQGLSAQLINTGDADLPYKIMVTGATGLAKAFTLSSSAAGLNLGTTLQAASNAALNVNGVAITSASNSVTDAIAGSTLNLLAATSGTASLNFNIDTSSVKTKLQALVTAYNDASQLLTEVSDPKSTLATYGATLVGNSVVSTIRNQLRELVTTYSSTTSGSISAGISAGSSAGASISAISFGAIPSKQDFIRFSVNVAGTLRTMTPAPATATLTALAANLQTQLRALDNGSTDLSVQVSGSTLTVVSASGRAISNLALTPLGHISALRDIGISIDSKGKLAINSTALDLALKFNYSDSVTMLSGNQQDQGTFDPTAAGVAGDAFKTLTTTLSSSGTLKAQSDNATKRIADYQEDLTKLEDRMTKLLARYIKQFSIMDSLVGQTNSLRTGLTSTFTGMQSIYNNK